MTMNIWLLVSVVIGACIGYAVGKPIVANGIHDAVTSHEYESVSVNLSRRGNRRSELSRSWRFHTVTDTQLEQSGGILTKNTNRRQTDEDKLSNGSDVIWLRRSSTDLVSGVQPDRAQCPDTDSDNNKTESPNPSASNLDSIKFGSVRSYSRFRSTSKLINASFRSQRSFTDELSKQSSSTSVFISGQSSPQTLPKQPKQASRTSSKVSRTSSTLSGRFKPVSKTIMRQRSFNEDSEWGRKYVYIRRMEL